MEDLKSTVKRWRLWTSLGWQDIKSRYRGSLLGPFWSSANLLTLMVGVGILYSTIFQQSFDNYIPYLATGVFAWFFLAATISDSVDTFRVAANYLKQAPIPPLVFVFRTVWRNIILALHNFLVIVGALIFFQIMPNVPYFLLGAALVIGNVFAISVIVSIAAARFRDLGQVVTHVLQLMLFLTPVFWPKESASGRSEFINFNPLAHLVELIRAPLLGDVPATLSVAFAAGSFLILTLTALAVYQRTRNRIIFWL